MERSGNVTDIKERYYEDCVYQEGDGHCKGKEIITDCLFGAGDIAS
jgi:hypothetical protein